MTKEQTFEHPPRGHVALLYYDVTNDRFQVVQGDDVDTAIPAAGKSLLASTLAHGYDGSAWRKLPLVWGYTDRWVEQVYVADADAGNNALATATVPAGYVYVLMGMTGLNSNSIVTQQHDLILAVTTCRLDTYSAVAAGVTQSTFPINCPMKAGDYARTVFLSCTLNDELFARFWGYKMRINM